MSDIPAFPVPAELCQDLTVEQQRGMTLRDYFAAKAMQGMLANQHQFVADDQVMYARDAYVLADAMLKARNGNS
jgi:hypothetical protein